MNTKLTGSERQKALNALPNWERVDGQDAITRTFTFTNFNAAFAFMTSIALRAEQMNHHPEWSNVYNRVDVKLTTHDAGGVTQKDISLALFIDELEAS